MNWSKIGIMFAGSGTGTILAYLAIGNEMFFAVWGGYVVGYIVHEKEDAS